MNLKLIPVALIGLIFISCGNNGKSTETSEAINTTADSINTTKEVEAVSIWDKVSVRESASDKGKWVTSLSLGETLTYLGKEEKDEKGKTYLHVRLNDGTEGWSRSEFVIPEAKPAVFSDNSDIYNRPDLLTKSDDQFKQMDVVAVKSSKDDWVEVIGKPSGEKWMKSGWVKSNSLVYDDVDIATAKFAKSILDENKDDKVNQLRELSENKDLSSSVFIPLIKYVVDSLENEQKPDPIAEPDSLATESIEEN